MADGSDKTSKGIQKRLKREASQGGAGGWALSINSARSAI